MKGDANDFADIVKGTFVKIDGDDIIKLVDKTNDAYLGAVEGTDGESFTVRNGNGDEYKIVDDTQVIYVDTDAIEGAEGGSIREATNHNDSSVYENNVFFVVDKNSKDGNTYELVAVFVDVNNELVTK